MSKNCPFCGTEIADDATRCYSCQKWLTETNVVEDKPAGFLETLLFAWFLGAFGIHRFYTGNVAIGIAQLLTLGGCGIWTYIDFILICFNKFKDGKGRLLRDYNANTGITIFVISLIPIGLVLFLLVCLGFAIAMAGNAS